MSKKGREGLQAFLCMAGLTVTLIFTNLLVMNMSI